MEDFTPVPLVSPKGRPWIARTAVELTNLIGKGYKRAEPVPEWTAPEDIDHIAGDLPSA